MNADLAAQEAIDKLHRSGFDSLTDKEKIAATVWLFESKVLNEGFEDFLSSPSGDVAFHGPAAFKAIGAPASARIAQRANDVFGPAGVPRDKGLRRTAILGLKPDQRKELRSLDSEFLESAEETDELLEKFLARK